MTKGRKMEPRPSNTKGSLSFSSGAMDSKSLAKNSSGSLALVRGLRSLHASSRAAASMACDGPASRVVYGGRSAADAGPRFWSGSCWKTSRLTSVRSDRAAGAKASTETCAWWGCDLSRAPWCGPSGAKAGFRAASNDRPRRQECVLKHGFGR